MAELFGFEFKRKKDQEPVAPSFTPKEQDDGALVIAAAGAMGTYVDLDGTVRTEAELVTKYREMSLQPEIDIAVDEITNHSICIDEEKIVRIMLDELNLSDKVKKAIESEFETSLNLLNFNVNGYDVFRRWYIDGRLYFHVVIDENNPKDGIKELRYVDPRKIRKIREVSKRRARGGDPTQSSAVLTKTENEYYIFNDKGFNYGNKAVGPSTTGLKIAKDAIVHVTSGLTDTNGTMVLSYLHKAIKPLNQLRTLEDAVVVYRISRAPERRLWYIDVGNLPKMKAEQYVRDIMVKHKNRLIYDSATGEVRDDRKFMTMLEDYWLPRREGGRGTEVSTLPAGQNLGEMEDVNYFKEKLYSCLYVPLNRLDKNNMFSIGNPTETTREELRFGKFIHRLRTKFNLLFLKILERQLVLKGVMTIEDWENIKNKIVFDYSKDSYFTELKDNEIMMGRVNTINSMGEIIGKYYSNYYVRKHILKQTDEEMEVEDELIVNELEHETQQNVSMGLGPDGAALDAGQQSMGGGGGGAPVVDDKEKLRKAKMTYQRLKDKKPKSKDEYSQLQKAVQVIAKSNDESAKSMITYRQQQMGTSK